LFQASANLARLDTNDAVVTGLISSRSIEYLRPNRPFLDRVGAPFEFVSNDVFEELPASNRVLEKATRQDPIQFREDGFRVWIIRRLQSFVFRDFKRGWHPDPGELTN
jgi:hypothetical protein